MGDVGGGILRAALARVKAGVRSPRETRLRLLLEDARLPEAEINWRLRDHAGRFVAELDLAYPQWRVAVEYDGDQHRTDRTQYVKDIRRTAELERMGWIVVRVVAEDRPAEILRRVRTAIASGQSTLR